MGDVDLVHVDAGFLGEHAREHLGRVRRHGGLQNDQIGRLEHLARHAAGGLDKLEIRLVAAGLVLIERGGHSDIEHIRFAQLAREMQVAVRDRLLKCLLQAGLDDVDVPALQRLDGFLIDVKAADFKSGLGQRDRGRQADVAQTHDSNFHSIITSLMTFSVHYTTFSSKFNLRFEFFVRGHYNGSTLFSYQSDRMYVYDLQGPAR